MKKTFALRFVTSRNTKNIQSGVIVLFHFARTNRDVKIKPMLRATMNSGLFCSWCVAINCYRKPQIGYFFSVLNFFFCCCTRQDIQLPTANIQVFAVLKLIIGIWLEFHSIEFETYKLCSVNSMKLSVLSEMTFRNEDHKLGGST